MPIYSSSVATKTNGKFRFEGARFMTSSLTNMLRLKLFWLSLSGHSAIDVGICGSYMLVDEVIVMLRGSFQLHSDSFDISCSAYIARISFPISLQSVVSLSSVCQLSVFNALSQFQSEKKEFISHSLFSSHLNESMLFKQSCLSVSFLQVCLFVHKSNINFSTWTALGATSSLHTDRSFQNTLKRYEEYNWYSDIDNRLRPVGESEQEMDTMRPRNCYLYFFGRQKYWYCCHSLSLLPLPSPLPTIGCTKIFLLYSCSLALSLQCHCCSRHLGLQDLTCPATDQCDIFHILGCELDVGVNTCCTKQDGGCKAIMTRNAFYVWISSSQWKWSRPPRKKRTWRRVHFSCALGALLNPLFNLIICAHQSHPSVSGTHGRFRFRVSNYFPS